jgi:hypothetical protein
MFVGSNHHHQNTIFGVALLRQETTMTFEWLFRSFKLCMTGAKKMRCILTGMINIVSTSHTFLICMYTMHVAVITLVSYYLLYDVDEDPAMAEAIRTQFAGVKHRLCRWHVTKKVQPQLNELASIHDGFIERFSSAINHPLTPQEFELAWREMIVEFRLEKDPMMNTLYKNRQDWVKAFFKADYCGRMTSTQRSESVNNMVKSEVIGGNTSLHMFPKQILRFIQRRSEAEAAEAYGGMVSYTMIICLLLIAIFGFLIELQTHAHPI